MSPLLDRIRDILISLKGSIIPVKVILSSETYEQLLEDKTIHSLIRHGFDPKVAIRDIFSIPFEIQEENTDIIVAKELFPDRCPICGRRIVAVSQIIKKLEENLINKAICPSGHRFDCKVRVYYLNIYRVKEEKRGPGKCPKCGSANIQYLSPTEAFCLDCDWDNL
jgi:hypothetical protein